MNPTRTYDYLAKARERVLAAAGGLPAEEYAREFRIGPGSLARTFTHVLISEWYYVERLLEREVPPYSEWPIKDEHPLPFDELVTVWRAQAAATREAIAAERDWARAIVYRVTDDEKRLVRAACTASDMVTQLALHEVHHRAQAMNMLRQLGVVIEDIDFNAMMYDREFITEG